MNENEFAESCERKLARLEKLELEEYRREQQRFDEILDMDEEEEDELNDEEEEGD